LDKNDEPMNATIAATKTGIDNKEVSKVKKDATGQ
jgi:hypothetical protein